MTVGEATPDAGAPMEVGVRAHLPTIHWNNTAFNAVTQLESTRPPHGMEATVAKRNKSKALQSTRQTERANTSFPERRNSQDNRRFVVPDGHETDAIGLARIARNCRKENGMTQSHAANLAGVSLRHYQKAESGSYPSPLINFLDCLNIRVEIVYRISNDD